MKQNKNNTETNVINPFAELQASTEANVTRRLDFTPVLQDKARTRATELCKACTTEDLQVKANRMMDTGAPADLLDLIHSVYDDETIKADSAVLDGCPEDELDKMLESQRSNRSKSKRAGLRTKLTNTVAYISAMYAELLIREKTGKPYNAGSRQIEYDLDALKNDQDALKRKINSLASKKSRLTKLAEYDESAASELAEVEGQLAELRALRPTKSHTAVKSVPVDVLKKALASLDKADMPEDVLELIEKIG